MHGTQNFKTGILVSTCNFVLWLRAVFDIVRRHFEDAKAVHKETELLVYCFTYNLIKLVSITVLPSNLDTPRPTFFPALERVLERVLPDGAKVPYRIFFYLLYRLKSATF